MDQPDKLSPRQVEALTQRLQSSLRQRRPRGWLVGVGVLAAAVGLLAALAWWLYPRPELPRLEVVAFDQAAAPGETPRLVAQLAFPDAGDYPPSLLRGLTLKFTDARAGFGPDPDGTTATTDAQGRAAVDWPAPAKDTVAQVSARYVDVRHRQASADQASLFAWQRGKVLLVGIEDGLADVPPERWASTHPANVAPRPGAGAALREAQRCGYQVGYLPRLPAPALDYRRARGWVLAQQGGNDRLPAGPVFAPSTAAAEADDPLAALLHDLRQRFGEDATLVVNRPAAVAAGRAAGWRVLTVAAPAPVAGVTDVPGWAELPGRLGP